MPALKPYIDIYFLKTDFVQCAAAGEPQAHAHVQLMMVRESNDPGRPAGPQRVVPTLPVQKHPAGPASQCRPFCLKLNRNLSRFCWHLILFHVKKCFLTLKLFAVQHLHMCIQILSGFSAKGPGQRALPTPL